MALALWPTLTWAQPDRLYTSLDEVESPTEVYRLRLRHKRLKEVPAEVLSMTNLRELDLRGNRLTHLPEGIGRLVHLERLEVSRNPLYTLPDSLAALPELRELVLWSTRVTVLPESYAVLDGRLKLIDLRSCPLSPANQEAIQRLLPSVEKLWDRACDCGGN